MAAHSSVLAWRITGMGEPGGLPSMGSQSRTRLKQLSSSSIRAWPRVYKDSGCVCVCVCVHARAYAHMHILFVGVCLVGRRTQACKQ